MFPSSNPSDGDNKREPPMFAPWGSKFSIHEGANFQTVIENFDLKKKRKKYDFEKDEQGEMSEYKVEKLLKSVLVDDPISMLSNGLSNVSFSTPSATQGKRCKSSVNMDVVQKRHLLESLPSNDWEKYTGSALDIALQKLNMKLTTSKMEIVRNGFDIHSVTNTMNIGDVVVYNTTGLYGHQRDIISYVEKMENQGKNGMVIASVGTGKTFCMGMVIMKSLTQQREHKRPTLYVCPGYLLGTVYHEFRKFFGPSLNILVYSAQYICNLYHYSGKNEFMNYDIVLIPYSSLNQKADVIKKSYGNLDDVKNIPTDKLSPTDRKLLLKMAAYYSALEFFDMDWYRIIMDESHELRSSKTQKFDNAMMLKSEKRWCMTGTPIQTGIGDLYTQLYFTHIPQLNMTPEEMRKIPKKAEFIEKSGMTEHIMYITREDIHDVDIPKKHTHLVFSNLGPIERQSYDKIYNELRNANDKRKYSVRGEQANLEKFIREILFNSMRICSTPNFIENTEKPGKYINMMKEFLTGYPKNYEFSKLASFVELMGTLLNTNEKIIVFTEHIFPIDLLIEAVTIYDEGFKERYRRMDSSIGNIVEREQQLTDFQNKSHIQVMFSTMKSGSTGFNLTCAKHMIFFEPWFSYNVYTQAEGRIHRLGQTEETHFYYLLTKDTLEEKVYNLALSKREEEDDITSTVKTSIISVANLNSIIT